MDMKDLLLQNENSLPAIDTNGTQSTAPLTGTGLSMADGKLPTVTASPLTYAKFGVSALAGLLGMYYLGAGKKQADLGKMILGAGLTLASFFLF
jgi:hypothetical protein